MQFVPKTVLGLFDSSQKRYIIPVYQRAYSWEKEQWKALIDDIKEQIAGENNYLLGNLFFSISDEISSGCKSDGSEVLNLFKRLTFLGIFFTNCLNLN